MQIILRSLGAKNDITKYVDVAPQVRDLTSFNTGRVIISDVHEDALIGINMALKVPLMSIVEINEDQYYVVQSDKVDKGDGYHTHTLDLVELAFLMTVRPIPNISVTQPVEAFKVPAVVEHLKLTDNFKIPLRDSKSKTSTFDVATPSNDIGVVDAGVIKRNGVFNVSANVRVYVITGQAALSDGYVKLKVNGSVLKTWNVGRITAGTSNDVEVSMNDNFTLSVGDEFKIEWGGTNNNYVSPVQVNINASVRVYYDPDEFYFADTIYLDEVVDKALLLNRNEINLSPSTKARLSNIKAFEEVFTDTTLWDVISRIARYVKAKPVITNNGGSKTLRFVYFDELAEQEWVDIIQPEGVVNLDINEYTSTLVTKNNNVVKDNTITEHLVLKTAEGNAQITTDNVDIYTTYPIERVIKVVVNGIDITSRVVERDYYETLDNMANYTDRAGDNKNNHLWYERGNNKIGGVAFIGAQFKSWSQASTNRAIYEVLACVQASTTTYVDQGAAGDATMTIEVTYTEMSEVEAHINKDDVTGFQERMIRKINANERVNNAELLGGFVRSKVNSIGNTKNAITGYGQLPNLGSISPDNYKVVNVTEYTGTEHYAVTLVKDHVIENEYVGIDDDKRLYIVPKDNIVRRRDISVFEVKLDLEPVGQVFGNFEYNYEILLGHLRGDGPVKINYASVDVDEIELMLPVSVVALGTTVTLNFDMLDNYNAAYQRIISGETTYQRGVRYTDRFGKADLVNVTLEAETVPSDVPLLPERVNSISSNFILNEAYKLIKDAREAYSYSAQFLGQSLNNQIIIYDGFAKYNRIVNNARIRTVEINYKPTRDDRYINTRGIVAERQVALDNEKITINGGKNNYAWYDVDTLELVLVLLNNNTIYYNVDRPLIGDMLIYMLELFVTFDADGYEVDGGDASKVIDVGANFNQGVSAKYEATFTFDKVTVGDEVQSDVAQLVIDINSLLGQGVSASYRSTVTFESEVSGEVIDGDSAAKHIMIIPMLERGARQKVNSTIYFNKVSDGSVVGSDEGLRVIGLNSDGSFNSQFNYTRIPDFDIYLEQVGNYEYGLFIWFRNQENFTVDIDVQLRYPDAFEGEHSITLGPNGSGWMSFGYATGSLGWLVGSEALLRITATSVSKPSSIKQITKVINEY